MNKKVLVLNLDKVKIKNLYQFNAMKSYGFEYVIFAYSPGISTKKSESYISKIYPTNIFLRLVTLLAYMMKHRSNIHHIELYTGMGSFLIFEFIMAKLFGLTVCIVERGSSLRDIEKYNILGRYGRKVILYFANYVWIREFWMIEALQKIGRKNYFFLSNCIELPGKFNYQSEKQFNFIWCNALIQWRHADWFADALKNDALQDKKSLLVGILKGNPTVKTHQDYIVNANIKNLQIHPFQDPVEFFLQSKFYVLPADIVYLNFSLLEAMSRGVVPIISDVDGAREIVEDGVDGILIHHDKQSLVEAMLLATQISDEHYERLSKNARKKVKEKFSIDSWSAKLNEFYLDIERK